MLFKVNTSAPISYHGPPGMSCWIRFSFGWVCYKSRHVEYFLYDFQHLCSYLSNKQICLPRVQFLFMPMWLICSCFRASCCNAFSVTICLSFMTTPWITAMLPLNVQYVQISCGSWSVLSGHSCMTYFMRCWKYWSWDVASCSLYIVICSSMLVVDCIALILICMSVISSSLFHCNYVWTASLPWIGLVQACIWFSTCIDVFLVGFTVASVIM